MNQIERIKQVVDSFKPLEVKYDDEIFNITYLGTDVIHVEFDEKGVSRVNIKSIPGLGEGLSNIILKMLPECEESELSSCLSGESDKEKFVNFILNFTGLLFSHLEVSSQSLVINWKRGEQVLITLMSSPDNSVTFIKTQAPLYGVMTKSSQYNAEFVMTLELIKALIDKGKELGITYGFEEISEYVEFLKEKLISDNRKKMMKQFIKTGSYILLILVLVWLIRAVYLLKH